MNAAGASSCSLRMLLWGMKLGIAKVGMVHGQSCQNGDVVSLATY
jgi:hypothetical protein